MADESKQDELLVMRLIAEGETKAKELADRLGWSQDRLEETLDDLQEHEYVQQAQKGGDRVLAITERGRDEIPRLVGEVMDETREYLDAVSESFRTHMDKVFPRVSLEVEIEEPETGGAFECDACGESFDSERGLKIHEGMEH